MRHPTSRFIRETRVSTPTREIPVPGTTGNSRWTDTRFNISVLRDASSLPMHEIRRHDYWRTRSFTRYNVAGARFIDWDRTVICPLDVYKKLGLYL